MKIYALTVLLALCVFQSEALARDWRNDVKINHWQQINTIINTALGRIQNEANSKGSAGAKACLETARSALRDVSQSGYRDVTSCVNSASTAGDASVCSQQVDSGVFDKSLQISKDASVCINNA